MPSLSAPRIDTDRLRHDHPIGELIGRYGIELRRSGASLTGRCPFHLDRGRPNLTVFPRSGRFICFRCGARGDAISFVQQIENLSFRDAVTRLGSTASGQAVTVRTSRRACRPASRAAPDPQSSAVLSAAVDLYRNRLLHDPAPLAYLAGRGFERDVVEQARLGYAVGDELVPYLNWRGLSIRAARKVGLLDVDNQERFAGRIVFPEYRSAQPVWMVGRTLATDVEPRYLGLPGAKPLLGWDGAIVDRRGVCLVEGPLDLLALRKWGVPAMGLCGTHVSEASLNELAGWKRLYVALDADDAGKEATDELVRRFGDSVITVQLPLGAKDPAELATRPDGADLFALALRTAVERHFVASH